jgi:OOP family OmpA-OmpF porin
LRKKDKEISMNKTAKYASALAALAALGMSATASAQGIYVGGSILQSRFDSDNFDVEDVDDEATSWKLMVGIRPTPNFAVEASYLDFGKSSAPSAAVGGPFEAEAQAFSAFGVGFLPVGPVELFAKAGAARIDAKGNVGAVFFDDEEIEFAYGAGAQLRFGALGLRAEYEKFDTDVIGDLDILSLGLTFTFGVE